MQLIAASLSSMVKDNCIPKYMVLVKVGLDLDVLGSLGTLAALLRACQHRNGSFAVNYST